LECDNHGGGEVEVEGAVLEVAVEVDHGKTVAAFMVVETRQHLILR
jgi:hypothetical protein